MKKNSKICRICYMGTADFLPYVSPIAVVIVFSFNESKLPVRLPDFP